jgi:hypothetical protein
MGSRWLVASLLLSACFATALGAQPASPPPPAQFKAVIRYDIPSARDQHVVQYDALVAHLEKLDFEFDPPLAQRPKTDREDRSKTRMVGTIASNKALALLGNANVASVLLVPAEWKLPEALDAPVSVRLELAGGLAPDRQREMSEQAKLLLSTLGFREAPAADSRGYTGRFFTRLTGTIPFGKLDTLLKDLRTQPGGWLAPLIPLAELPSPLRTTSPIRVIEVLPDNEAVKELAEVPARSPEYLDKISADLWELVKEKEVEPTVVRVQIIIAGTLPADENRWRETLLQAAPNFFVEGYLGNGVAGLVPLDQVKAIAALPAVSVVRLPRPLRVDIDPALKTPGDNARALNLTGVAGWHARGVTGKGARIAILDSDFRGWEKLVKDKKLPAKTRLVDLTLERNPDLNPAPDEGDPAQIGHGTLCAQAAALAAPDAEFILIRLDLLDPYQLYDIQRYLKSDFVSPSVERRRGEVASAGAILKVRRELLLKERTRVNLDFTDETDLEERRGFLGPLFPWLYSEREWHRQRWEIHQAKEAKQQLLEIRLDRWIDDLIHLKDVHVVVNTQGWNSGIPLGASSSLSRWFDEASSCRPIWFQAAGNTRGQNWLGSFRTFAGDTPLEFADADAPLKKGRWTRTLNFLSWQPWQGKPQDDLPEKTKVRLTVQWQEPHDPDYFLRPGEEDWYRKPLATLKMSLLRQRDPLAKVLSADAFDLVARSSGLPQRLDHQPSGSVYEVVLETTLDQAGRYALRIDRQADTEWTLETHPGRKTPLFKQLQGLNPVGNRPLGAPSIPAAEKSWDLRPRVFVEVVDDANRRQGRAVFQDFATEAGAIGAPADSRGVISVGAANLQGVAQPYSATGTPAQMEIFPRPTVLAPDELALSADGAFGTSVAAPHAAGAAALLLSAGYPAGQVYDWLRAHQGQVLRLPPLPK